MIWAIFILASVLRLISINQSFWLDEASQVLLSFKSINFILYERPNDFHPPLYYLLVHFWLFLGSGEIWLRILSVLIGVATVASVYLMVREIFNKKIAFLSAFLLAISPFHIYYSQEVRMYALATLLAVWSLYFFLKSERGLFNKIFYVLSTTALIYTHYMGFFIIIAQLAYLILVERKIKLKKIGLFLGVFILYLPWLPQLFQQLNVGSSTNNLLPGWNDILSVPFYKALPLTFLKFSLGRIDFYNKLTYGVIAGLVSLVFGSIGFFGIKESLKSNIRKAILIWLVAPLFLAIIISFKLPMDQPFRLLFIIPAFYILLSFGLAFLKGKVQITMLVLVCLISAGSLLLYWTDPRFQREDWRGAALFIQSRSSKDTMTVFAWPGLFPPMEIYTKNLSFIGAVKSFPAQEREVKMEMSAVRNKKEVFLFQYLQALSDPNKLVQKWLSDNGFTLKATYDFHGVGFIYDYQKN